LDKHLLFNFVIIYFQYEYGYDIKFNLEGFLLSLMMTLTDIVIVIPELG